MKAFYESAIEPECPLPAYDPAMDEPEPPTPRRKPPFETLRTRHGQIHTRHIETLRTHHGQIHTLHGETRLYTGCYESCGETYKWAAIGIKYARHESTVQCDRKSAAKMLRTIRKEGVC